MPFVKRTVDMEVSNDELIRDLQEFVEQRANTAPVCLFDDTGNPTGEEISPGDLLMVKPLFYENSNIANDTVVLVNTVDKSMGIVGITYVNKAGDKVQSFFNPAIFAGKYGKPNKAAGAPLSPVNTSRKGRRRS